MNDKVPIRILMVEDVPTDAELAERVMRKEGLVFNLCRVETEKEFLYALSNFKPDIVISDYMLPEFDGMRALKISLSNDPLLPFIVFTGSMNEETAVICMKAGATDYVVKEHNKRLPFAVIEALKQKKIRKKKNDAESTLRESEEKFRILSESCAFAIMIYQGDYWVYSNPAGEQISGYSTDELYGMHYWDFVSPEFQSIIKERGARRQAGEVVRQNYDFEIIAKDGGKKWVNLTGCSITYRGRPAGLISVVDITERKKSEETIAQAEAKYHSIFENAIEGIFQTTMEGKIISANPSIAKMFGYDSPEDMMSSVTDVAHDLYANPEDREKFKSTVAAQERIDNFEVLGRKKGGTAFWINFNARAIKDAGGKILFYEGTVEDITSRKRAEFELKQNSRRQQAILHLYRMSYAPKEEITSFVVEECVKISGSDLAFVGFVNEDESFMETHLWSRKAMDTCEADKPLHFPIEKAGIWAEAIRQRRTIVINDYSAPNPDKKGYPEGHVPVKSFLGVPLVEKGRVVAVAGVANKAEDYTELDQNNINLLIEGMWSFLQRKKAEENLSSTLETLRKAMGGIIQVVASTVEAKDPYTAGHQRRVANLARTIAQEMGLPSDVIEGIRTAGTIHDIGKISIPSEILTKPTKLLNLEFLLIKEHPGIAYNILKDIEFPWPIANIVVQHHERLDGSGYPNGLKGNDILPEARIIAVADVVEAISTHRPYRPALGIGPALEEIVKNRGILYDPEVVDVCLKLFREGRFKFE